MKRPLPLIFPGEILLEEYLRPLGISQSRLAREIQVSVSQVGEVIRGRRPLSRELATRLAVYFGTSPAYWINLQASYDAKLAGRELMPLVSRQIRPRVPA